MDIVKRTPGEWDDFFMHVAVSVSSMSKDPNRKVGAVLVSPDKRYLSFGFNGFPSHIPDTKANLEDKSFKRAMVHAEINCLKQTASPIFNGTMYVTRFPCCDCATEIILQSKAVSRLVAPEPNFEHPTWGDSWRKALYLFNHYNLEVTMRQQNDD